LVSARREPSAPSGWPAKQVPNFSDWNAGDILLVHRTLDVVGRGIVLSQTLSLSPITSKGAEWTHAAIYVGGGILIDATLRKGVAAHSVWDYASTRQIRVRRIADPSVPASDIADIASEAHRHIGKSYSLLQAIASKLVPGTVPDPNALYCSTFVGLVVANATQIDLSSDPMHQPLHPGTLAEHGDLADVDLEWRLV
jgi:cell wall-associated NlpC family hydrolase